MHDCRFSVVTLQRRVHSKISMLLATSYFIVLSFLTKRTSPLYYVDYSIVVSLRVCEVSERLLTRATTVATVPYQLLKPEHSESQTSPRRSM